MAVVVPLRPHLEIPDPVVMPGSIEAEQALLTFKSNNGTIADIAAFYRAMCLSQQKKSTEAHALFTIQEEKIKPFLTDDKKPLSEDAGPDDLLLWLAYKEAKALISGASTPGN